MGIIQKYRVGDRFIARLDEIIDDGKDVRYVLDLGGLKTYYTKHELARMKYLPIYMTTEGARIVEDGAEMYERGFRQGYRSAKLDVMKALGIEDAEHGYRRAKEAVIKALDGDKDVPSDK